MEIEMRVNHAARTIQRAFRESKETRLQHEDDRNILHEKGVLNSMVENL